MFRCRSRLSSSDAMVDAVIAAMLIEPGLMVWQARQRDRFVFGVTRTNTESLCRHLLDAVRSLRHKCSWPLPGSMEAPYIAWRHCLNLCSTLIVSQWHIVLGIARKPNVVALNHEVPFPCADAQLGSHGTGFRYSFYLCMLSMNGTSSLSPTVTISDDLTFEQYCPNSCVSSLSFPLLASCGPAPPLSRSIGRSAEPHIRDQALLGGVAWPSTVADTSNNGNIQAVELCDTCQREGTEALKSTSLHLVVQAKVGFR